MEPIDIRYALEEKGYSLARIATELGLSRQAIHLTVNGKSESQQIKSRISEILQKPVDEIWSQKQVKAPSS